MKADRLAPLGGLTTSVTTAAARKSTRLKGVEPSHPGCRGPAALPTRQALPRTGLTLPPSWCHRCQA